LSSISERTCTLLALQHGGVLLERRAEAPRNSLKLKSTVFFEDAAFRKCLCGIQIRSLIQLSSKQTEFNSKQIAPHSSGPSSLGLFLIGNALPTAPPTSRSPNTNHKGTQTLDAPAGHSLCPYIVNTAALVAAPSHDQSHGRQRTVALAVGVRFLHNTRKVSSRTVWASRLDSCWPLLRC
jgi:hypothetical protein